MPSQLMLQRVHCNPSQSRSRRVALVAGDPPHLLDLNISVSLSIGIERVERAPTKQAMDGLSLERSVADLRFSTIDALARTMDVALDPWLLLGGTLDRYRCGTRWAARAK